MHISSFQRTAQIILAALLIIGISHGVARAQGLSGTSWSIPGELKAKVQKAGKFGGPLPFGAIHFGPQVGLAASEFMLILDDGIETITATGTYGVTPKGKPVLSVDGSSIASDIEDLLESIGGLPPNTVSISCPKVKAKAKLKTKQGVEIMRASFAAKCVATVILTGDSIKVGLKLKKAQGLQIP